MTGRIIRPSQFILSYGVGSIIETDRGSRIIPVFQRWGKYFLSSYDNKKIDDASALNQLLNYSDKPQIFSISTNSDLNKNDSKDIYKLSVFPRWGVCMNHSGVPILGQINEQGVFYCSYCKKENNTPKVTGIRFVSACSKGHLEDVDWPFFVHLDNNYECDGILFGWTGEGQASNDLRIYCIKCRSQIRLSDIYKLSKDNKIKCGGNFAESKRNGKGCSLNAKLLLRSGSNLRIPEILTSLCIPYRDSELYRILSKQPYYTTLSLLEHLKKNKTVEDLTELLRISMSTNLHIKENEVKEIESFSDKELSDVSGQLVRDNTKGKVTEHDVKNDEYIALKNASVYGHPPEHNGKPSKFEVEKTKIREIDAASTGWKLPFTVTPIKTLSVILVQLGYRRMVGPDTGDLVKTFYEDDDGNSWFPGIETIGEGVFIRLKHDGLLPSCNESWKIWMKIFENRYNQNSKDYHKFHPFFVWWHSLSHRIINSLAIDSGYSSASIRERIYLRMNEINPNMLLEEFSFTQHRLVEMEHLED